MKSKKLVLSFVLSAALLLGGCAGTDGRKDDQSGTDPSVGGEIESPVGEAENAVESYWKDEQSYGITVTQDGVMMLGEKPLYVAGVNCFNLFNRCLGDYDAQEAFRTLDVLKSHRVGVVRFDCGGYDYSYIGQYLKNKERYLGVLKEIAAYAEQCRIGLIPSFFWLHHAVPDYFDEPIRAWGKESSRTIAFMDEYAADVTEALKGYRSVFAWEFGNEFNLSCDLPNAAEHMPALPAHSTRTSRTQEDYLSATDVSFAFGRFASNVRSRDPHRRMITSGNASLRPSQYHQLHENSWTQDSEEEYAQMCKLFTPGQMDAICEHIYFTEQKTFGRDMKLSEYVGALLSIAKNEKKAFIVGEWGGGTSDERKYYSDIVNIFVDAGVQLTMLWNFNLGAGETEYSFSADSERGQMLLDVLSEANERIGREFYGK